MIDLAGPPYFLPPAEVLTKWTLPQALFAWIRRQEDLAADARQALLLRMTAIGAVFSDEGRKIADRVLKSLEGEPLTVEEVMDQLDEQKRLILFGKSRLEHKANPDKNKK